MSNENKNEDEKDKESENFSSNSNNSPSHPSNIEIVPFKNYFLKIFISPSRYYLLNRQKYDLNTIMMMLDLNKINKLYEFYKVFDPNDEIGIERLLFIEKMKKELPCNLNDPMDETNLVYGLYKFFCEIDFNGDGNMQWKEFTQFIINTVEGDNDAKVGDDEEDTHTKVFNEKEMIKYKRYHISKRLKDNLIHKKDVINAIFLPNINLIILNEYGTKTLKLYNPKTGRGEKSLELDLYLNPQRYMENENKSLRKKLNFNKIKKNFSSNEKNGKEGNNDNGNNSDKAGTNNNLSMTYSVLWITKYHNIVAMCLSDRRIIFLHFASEDRIEFIYEMTTPVLEKRLWYLPEHNIWLSSGCKMDKFSYFTINELDIEFELHNQKYECLYNIDHPYRSHFCEKLPHMGEIMDCIEILKPKMIVTACMDGKIRLINLTDRDIVKCWNNHALGVRFLNYNPLIDNVGYVLSVGFEYFINVYCTDLSIDEAYKGKLEGHYAPVISCQFLSNSYMAVSVDEEGNIRIWDTKLKICLQLIGTPKKNLKVTNLLCLPKYNKFMIYGNKIIYYDAQYKEDDNAQKNTIKDDNYPIKVDFNKYYQQFFVTTFKDVRVYTKEGQMFKCYKKLISNEHFEPETRIKNFLFENAYRKFYVGFSNGAIMQFNAGNGSLIKPVNEKEIEKDGIQTYVYSHTKEVNSMYFYFDEEIENSNILLLSTGFDSLINVYNEANTEETEKLRTIRGGHTLNGKTLDICCMDFSLLLNIFATGGMNSLVVVWDFEMSKIEDIFYISGSFGDKLNVNYLKFLDPYPVLAAAYNDGSIYLWGVRQSNNFRGECILRVRNYYKQYRKINLSPVKFMNIFNGEMKDIKSNVPLKKYFDENSPFMNPNVPYIKPTLPIKENETEEEMNLRISMEEDLNLDIVPKIFRDEVIDYKIDTKLYQFQNENEDLNKSGENSTNNNTVKERYYLIIGDIQGGIKVIDLLGFFRKNQIEPASKVTIKSSFNVLKKDDINMETILNHNIIPITENKLPKFTNMYYNMIINEFHAHNEEITCITLLEEPLCFVTASKDKFVKIWSYEGECLGVINALPKFTKFEGTPPKWKFKIDEKKILEDEINELVGIFKEVGVETVIVGSKTDKEVENLQVPEKTEINNTLKYKEKDLIDLKSRNRFKKITKEENKGKHKMEENKAVMSFEGFYVQEAEKKIEEMINNSRPKLGITEITNKIINTCVENKEKIKNELKNINKNKKKSIAYSTMNNYTNVGGGGGITNYFSSNSNVGGAGTSKVKKKISFNIEPSDISNNLLNNNNTIEPSINNNNNNNGVNIKKVLSMSSKPVIEDKKEKEPIAIPEINLKSIMEIDEKIPEKIPTSKTRSVFNKTLMKPENPSKVSSKIFYRNKTNIDFNKTTSSRSGHSFSFNNINNITSRRKKSDTKRKIRDALFSEHLFDQLNGKNNNMNIYSLKHNQNGFHTDRGYNKEEFSKKIEKLRLPLLNDKIIFNKGETEKLLNYQFYTTSYRACCKITNQSDIPNSSMKENYKNNWDLVKQFANEKREKERLKERLGEIRGIKDNIKDLEELKELRKNSKDEYGNKTYYRNRKNSSSNNIFEA